MKTSIQSLHNFIVYNIGTSNAAIKVLFWTGLVSCVSDDLNTVICM